VNRLRRLLNRIMYAQEKSLFHYEAACLEAFRRVLPGPARLILESQFDRYDFVQRSPNGRHLSFFDADSDGLCRDWPESALFALRTGPVAVCRFRMASRTEGNRSEVTAELFFFGGRVVGIEFSQLGRAKVARDPRYPVSRAVFDVANDMDAPVGSVEVLRDVTVADS
jgi:hypothetical protein